MMTLRELLESVNMEGYVKVQCWEDDAPTVYHEGDSFYGMDEKYLDRNVVYIFPYYSGDFPGITIELEAEES